MTLALRVANIKKHFDGVLALDDVSLTCGPGRITGLFGPNGAGKTTLFNLVNGFEIPDAGTISYDGDRLDGKKPWDIARLGVGRLFQDVRVLPSLTVLDNVRLAATLPLMESPCRVLFMPHCVHEAERKATETAQEWLGFVGLSACGDARAEALSYGQQKLLALGCVLARGAKLLLLDEPTAGLAVPMVERVVACLKRLQALGRTIVAIEHDPVVLSTICDTVYLMERGRVVGEGPPTTVLASAWASGPAPEALVSSSSRGRIQAVAEERPALSVEGLRAGYGKKEVLHDLSFTVHHRERVALLGLNGAGKSTVLKAVSGLLSIRNGHVQIDGQDVTGWSISRRLKAGLMCPYMLQHSPVFRSLSVAENLALAGQHLTPSGCRARLDLVLAALPVLAGLRRRRAGLLSGGERRLLSAAMALLAAEEPHVLLLDEPSAGLPADLAEEVLDTVFRVIADEGTAIVLVEQDTELALAKTDRALLLRNGRVIDCVASRDLTPETVFDALLRTTASQKGTRNENHP